MPRAILSDSMNSSKPNRCDPERYRFYLKWCRQPRVDFVPNIHISHHLISFQFAKASHVPKHWGGDLVDDNGDEMCRDRLNIPSDPIPQEIYWKPDEESPDVKSLTQECIAPRNCKILTYVVKEEKPTYFILNRWCDRTFGQGIWFSKDERAVDWPLEEMDEWCPDFDYPGMPTVDWLKIKVPGKGVYKLKFGNEQAWFRSLTIYHRMRFVGENNEEIDYKKIP